ncbi:alcohol dehydrogenase 1-like [Culicoides brevitarsis]|uniref:alcohol dehydrogenase 1-like n=1 Tax=Culicoides brevitarsis TaxID=469753 RepID=UPI00307C8733
MDLSTKKAIVIGGAGGIGVAIVENLVQRGIQKLAVIDMLEEEKASKLFKTEVFYKKCSVTDEIELESAMKSLKDEMEGLDIVINSAGISNEHNRKALIDINYGGVVNSTFAAIKLMRKDQNGNTGGFIINIASTSALGGFFMCPIYAGSKHAVLGFTRSFNNSGFIEKTGLRFITICPGPTETPLVSNNDFVHHFPEMTEETVAIWNRLPMQKADFVGKCILAALDDAQNGAVWRVQDSRYQKIELQDFSEFE